MRAEGQAEIALASQAVLPTVSSHRLQRSRSGNARLRLIALRLQLSRSKFAYEYAEIASQTGDCSGPGRIGVELGSWSNQLALSV